MSGKNSNNEQPTPQFTLYPDDCTAPENFLADLGYVEGGNGERHGVADLYLHWNQEHRESGLLVRFGNERNQAAYLPFGRILDVLSLMLEKAGLPGAMGCRTIGYMIDRGECSPEMLLALSQGGISALLAKSLTHEHEQGEHGITPRNTPPRIDPPSIPGTDSFAN